MGCQTAQTVLGHLAHPCLGNPESASAVPLRKAGLLTLRGYLMIAAVLVVVRIVRAAGH
ncbi:hypothetical protein [Mycobacterium montefiorense]|uniref:Uncharacterized protein n=1 Tax=Mycobacterium montefiorense TaxID=154654 RepID=A0AA37PIK2_9MYCO|nr:hypothetical protein [Mycobacterium montefiorense]GBG36365.1 hypothetical protein MmonteBS_07370 [Mycobacterium montefiorense]GKU36735.1 hypothetical protein NJB14191_40810 [Mycobacterium montefiorense]GKU42466.1 hypothetical protein NJB14192_44490 [Mycobacterium montefiorense]GKU48397.1 hypothetical protein NJB14194_50120 [Mycobacterium montefiorense]GKU53829.1 hypothetical protein NJB14195_50700 [Mycobacterium montefiorense]